MVTGATVSQASARFGSRTDGIVVSFVDDTFFASTGRHGAARVKDTTTPANNYDSHPYGLLTYTSPALKLTRRADGLYRYQAHNLFLNSDAPATQSVATLANATYQVIVTGSGTVTLSNAGTGVASAGSPVSFTAGTGTLTCTVAGGPTTVQVVRTPVEAGYVATAGAVRLELPYEWDANGNPLGILNEAQRVSIALWASDFTNAVWVKSNITAAKTATGPSGVANSASTLTATADGGTALQTITSASAARITYCWIKRRTGSGTVELTQDNGSTWTAVAVTGAWTMVALASVTSANPIVGIRLGTSGDAVDVAWFQHVAAAITSSPIETFAATATRAGDNISIATSLFPLSATLLTMGVCCETSKLGSSAIPLELQAAARADSLANFSVATAQTLFAVSGAAFASQASLTHTPLTTGESQRISASATTNDFRSYRDDEPSGQNPDTSGTFQSTAFAKLVIGGIGNGQSCLEGHIREIFYFPQTSTNDELRTLTMPVAAAEIAKSPHLIGDSFLNGVGLEQYLRKNLTSSVRSWSKDGVGGSSLADQKTRFDATPWHYGQPLIIMDGGLTDSLATAQASIQGMIAHLTHDRWLYIENGYTPGQDETGMTERLVQDAIHAWIIDTYPGHYVPTLATMQTYSDGSAGDIAAVAAGLWPTSQTSDGLHPTTGAGGGQEHLAQIIVDAINAKGW
jgi:hypothetical protein